MMLRLSIFFLVVAGIFVGGVYYFLRPRGLGVSYTAEDYESIKSKIGVTFEDIDTSANPGKTLIVTGSHKVDQTFTSEELTAGIDKRSEVYAYFPFRNVQIRVNQDGSVEGSATVNYKDALNYLTALGVSPDDVAKGAEKFNIPAFNIPVYAKFSGNVVNNQSNISVAAAKIAGVSVPDEYVREYTPALNDLVESVIEERRPSYDIQKLEVVSGKVHLQGSAPDREMALKKI